jgi:uncharacterized membrane protein
MFAIGLLVFFGAHLFTALSRGPRAALVKGLGAGGYKGLYSVVSIIGFALIILGWDTAPADALYIPPAYFRHLTYLFTALAMVLLVAAYAPAGRIAAAVRHPMLAATKLWAFGHLLANGEARAVLLFGAFLIFAVVDRIAVKARGDLGRPFKSAIGDGVAVVAGLAAWAAIYFGLHAFIAGVALR